MAECQSDIFDAWLSNGLDDEADVVSHATKEADASSHSTRESDASSHSTKHKKEKLDVGASADGDIEDADSGSTADMIYEMLVAYMEQHGLKVGPYAPAGESNKAFLEAYSKAGEA